MPLPLTDATEGDVTPPVDVTVKSAASTPETDSLNKTLKVTVLALVVAAAGVCLVILVKTGTASTTAIAVSLIVVKLAPVNVAVLVTEEFAAPAK